MRKDRAGNEVSSLAVGSPNNKPAGDLCSTFASWPLLRRLHAQNLMPVVAILEFSLLSLNPSFAREGDGTTEHAWSHPYPFPQDGFCLPCGPFAFLAGAASPFCSPIQGPRHRHSEDWGQDQHLPALNPGTEGSPRRDCQLALGKGWCLAAVPHPATHSWQVAETICWAAWAHPISGWHSWHSGESARAKHPHASRSTM